MKTSFTQLTLAICLSSFTTAFAATGAVLTPLNGDELSGGASCVLTDSKGNTLVTDQAKVNGKIVTLTRVALTSNTKKWTGGGAELAFNIAKGKLKETANGFNVGKSAMGQLTITTNGSVSKMKAQEVCYGAD